VLNPPEQDRTDRRSEVSESTYSHRDSVSSGGSGPSDVGGVTSTMRRPRDSARRSPPASGSTTSAGLLQQYSSTEFTERDRHLLMVNNQRLPGASRSRRTSKSSGVADNDLRSMTEDVVTDFARSEPDSFSEASGPSSR
jgi:hypothetical protein